MSNFRSSQPQLSTFAKRSWASPRTNQNGNWKPTSIKHRKRIWCRIPRKWIKRTRTCPTYHRVSQNWRKACATSVTTPKTNSRYWPYFITIGNGNPGTSVHNEILKIWARKITWWLPKRRKLKQNWLTKKITWI